MPRISTYLNFGRETAHAFAFYREVFGTEYLVPPVRFGELPPVDQGGPEIAEADRDLIMNVQLPIAAGHVLMGTDSPTSMGMVYTPGNNVSLQIHVDDRVEADRLFAALGDGGEALMPLQDMFWGDYWGELRDRFGVQWMVTTAA